MDAISMGLSLDRVGGFKHCVCSETPAQLEGYTPGCESRMRRRYGFRGHH